MPGCASRRACSRPSRRGSWSFTSLPPRPPLRRAAPPTDAMPVADAKREVDLTALRDAVDAAGKKGENVEEIRKALDAFEKARPTSTAGQRAAGTASASRRGRCRGQEGRERRGDREGTAGGGNDRRGQVARAGRSRRNRGRDPNPTARAAAGPEPGVRSRSCRSPCCLRTPVGGVGGGDRVEMFNKAMELRRKAVELMLKDPNDPERAEGSAEASSGSELN